MADPTRHQDSLDPRGLIREAYVIDGIGPPECRSIFLDWAMGVPEHQDMQALIRKLLDRHEGSAPDHPMTQVLRDGLGSVDRSGRRGGRRGRLSSLRGRP